MRSVDMYKEALTINSVKELLITDSNLTIKNLNINEFKDSVNDNYQGKLLLEVPNGYVRLNIVKSPSTNSNLLVQVRGYSSYYNGYRKPYNNYNYNYGKSYGQRRQRRTYRNYRY